MSAVAIVSVAALCAGYLWVERRTVRRLAGERRTSRRARGVLSWEGTLAGPADPLAQALEQTVVAADVVWAIHDRLFTQSPARESPFEVRRARVNATWRTYVSATARLHRATEAWLAAPSEPDLPQRRMAVERVAAWLDEQNLGPRWARGENLAATMDVGVDVLENALANLRRAVASEGESDPFRTTRPVDLLPRQDVSASSHLATARRAGSSSSPLAL